ncbi:hypothetical protein [uncultured Brevundimonas sp.]|uniref:hypothetical protein n=2 Tax=Brevundimonas TaxID=41275 RepID=UPI002632125E|nr:hypothetical protein [uncultured Brevundimonas sp.]
MKLKPLMITAAASLGLYACSPGTEAPAAPEPATVAVPEAYIGVWSSSNCARPFVRIGVSEIRNMGSERAIPLTSAEAFPDGRLILTYLDDVENAVVTETWKLADGKLDLVRSVWPDSTDDWASDPMSPCSGPTPLDG